MLADVEAFQKGLFSDDSVCFEFLGASSVIRSVWPQAVDTLDDARVSLVLVGMAAVGAPDEG